MMPNLPSRLQIGPHPYSMAYDTDIGERGANGETYVNACRIAIHEGLAPSKEQQVVLHEVLHAVWHNTALAAEGHDAVELEEQVIAALTPGLLQALQQNAELRTYLMPLSYAP